MKSFVLWNLFAGCDVSGSSGGWSMKTMKGVVSEAGAYLEKLKEEPVEESGESARQEKYSLSNRKIHLFLKHWF